MIGFDTIDELQDYIKVNSDFSIEYIMPFFTPANIALCNLVGAEKCAKIEQVTTDLLYAEARRFIAVNALLMSKGIQNVKIRDEGFTRYSELGKNSIAASSEAMKLFADDLAAYAAYCDEVILSLCEKDDTWTATRYSTISNTWLKDVDVLEDLSGKRISRVEFRRRKNNLLLYQTALRQKFGREVWTIITGEGSNVAKEAYTLAKQIIAGAYADDNFTKTHMYDMLTDALNDTINSNKAEFGLKEMDFGAFDTGNSVCF